MVFQVQEETWLDYQEIQGMVLCERVFTEDTVPLENTSAGVQDTVSSVNTLSHIM